MTKWKLDDDLRAKIDYEGGIDSFFRGYISPDQIEDPKLVKLAKKFVKAAQELEDYIGPLSEDYKDV